jgi:UDP-N-acetylmuramate dehydrogenase
VRENHRVARHPAVRTEVPLDSLTTLQLGGPARALVEVASEADVRDGLAWAAAEGLPVAVVGGGSNLVAADAGFPGLVVRVALRGLAVRREVGGSGVMVTAAAGERWDDVVAQAVREGWAGIECLSGIPGTVGATPIQNVGAYGQDVAETIVSVRVFDATTLAVADLAPSECSFGYRDSRLRREPGRRIVLGVTFRLRPGGAAQVRYPELARALAVRESDVSLSAAREAVIELRRGKSMVLEPDDPNRRSVGSFFVNPVLSPVEADEVARRAQAAGAIAGVDELPRFPAGDGREKLSAAWLVEHAGFARGTRRGGVGISSRHCLALVHHGGGTAAELVALAREIRSGVAARFGVLLQPEPVFLGFPTPDPVSAP